MNIRQTSKRNRIFITLLLIIVSVIVVYAASQDDSKRIIFQSGNLIKASEINSNFKYLYDKIATGGVDLVGFMLPFIGDPDNAPDGWLVCDGRTLEAEEKYSVLCSRLKGRACTNGEQFTLPDLRGRVIAGVDKKRSDETTSEYTPTLRDDIVDLRQPGNGIGSQNILLSPRQLPNHKHRYTDKVRSWKSQSFAVDGNVKEVPVINTGVDEYDNYYPPHLTWLLTYDPVYYYDEDAETDRLVQTVQPVDVVQPTLVFNYLIRY